MAVKGGNSSEKQVVAENKVYTGLGKFKVIGFNPSLEELKKIGREPQKEPEYIGENQDGKYFRLDTWVKGKNLDVSTGKEVELLTKFSIFLRPEPRTNRDGNKTQFINKKGETGWDESLEAIKNNPSYDWLSEDGLREAYPGEETLVNFLKAWLNIDPRSEEAECQLETMKKIVETGDVTELREIKNTKNEDGTSIKDNELKLLCIARTTDNGRTYQDIYTGGFGRASTSKTSDISFWSSLIDNEFTGLRDNQKLQDDSLEFQEYQGSMRLNRGNEDSSSIEGDPTPLSSSEIENDDLAF